MKMKYKYILLALVVFTGVFAGCNKWDETFKEFIGDGEITYVGKADSLKVRGGKNRAELSWLFISDPKIKGYKVYWNNRRDSIVVNDFQRSQGVDSVKLMITDIDEGTHYFEIFTFDNSGHTSVKSEVVGRVYGPSYERSLLNRGFTGFGRDTTDRILNWIAADPANISSKVTYVNADGETVEIPVGAEVTTTRLSNIPYYRSMLVQSAFIPEKNALDTFYTVVDTIRFGPQPVNWNAYDIVWGYNGTILSRLVNRVAASWLDVSTNLYSEPFAITGTGWNAFADINNTHRAVLAWNKASGFLQSYILNATTGTFGASTRISAVAEWKLYDAMLVYKGNPIARDASTPDIPARMDRYNLNYSTGTVASRDSLVGDVNWSSYNLLTAARDWIYGRTNDGRLWRIEVIGNEAQTPVLVPGSYGGYVDINNHGNALLGKTSNGELVQWNVRPDGSLEQPVKIEIPTNSERRIG